MKVWGGKVARQRMGGQKVPGLPRNGSELFVGILKIMQGLQVELFGCWKMFWGCAVTTFYTEISVMPN